MEITLTRAASVMLYRMFFQPQSLTEDKPYSAADAVAASDIVAVTRWLGTKVFEKADAGTEKERYVFRDKWAGKVKQRYIDRIKDVAKHYEKSGRVIINCESYMDLINALDGKTCEGESVEE